MNRRQFLTVTGAASAALLTSASTWPFNGPQHEPLLIAGSTNVLPFTKDLVAAFVKLHPTVDVVAEGGGSLAGLIALKRGAIDIAALSREIKRTEDDATFRDTLFAKDAIAIVTHPGNPVAGLSRTQVREVLAGRIADWEMLGGPAGPIELINRAPGSTTRRWVEENLMAGDDILRQAAVTASAHDMAAAVAAKPQAFGYLATRDFSDAVKTLTVDGVTISRPTIYSGRYPLTRSLYYVTRSNAGATAQRFLSFVRSPEAQAILEPELLRVY